MKGWYKAIADRALPPAQITLEQIMAEQVALYCHIPPPEENISITTEYFLVGDLVPTEENIEGFVRGLRSNHSGDTSGMRLEHLCQCL